MPIKLGISSMIIIVDYQQSNPKQKLLPELRLLIMLISPQYQPSFVYLLCYIIPNPTYSPLADSLKATSQPRGNRQGKRRIFLNYLV